MTDSSSSTAVSTAVVSTDRPGRYGKQLAAHLGRRNGSGWSEETQSGWIQFQSGRAELSCRPDALLLRVEGTDDALANLEDVVGRHLVRFGTHDELVVDWTRADGSAGTSQRNDRPGE